MVELVVDLAADVVVLVHVLLEVLEDHCAHFGQEASRLSHDLSSETGDYHLERIHDSLDVEHFDHVEQSFQQFLDNLNLSVLYLLLVQKNSL